MRLFVGIDPPEPIRQWLLAMMGGVSGARWQSAAQLHITLRFIGEVERAQLDDIDAALGSLHAPAFQVQASGVGAFDKNGRVHTLYTHVSPATPLHHLHEKLDHALVRSGLPAETRAYVPHITLARLGGGRIGGLEHFLAGSAAASSPPFAVTSFCLFESVLTRQGAHYSILARYPLIVPDQKVEMTP